MTAVERTTRMRQTVRARVTIGGFTATNRWGTSASVWAGDVTVTRTVITERMRKIARLQVQCVRMVFSVMVRQSVSVPIRCVTDIWIARMERMKKAAFADNPAPPPVTGRALDLRLASVLRPISGVTVTRIVWTDLTK